MKTQSIDGSSPLISFPPSVWNLDDKSGMVSRIKSKIIDGKVSAFKTQYTISDELGSGCYGTVFLLKPEGNTKPKAVKIIKETPIDEYGLSSQWPKNTVGLALPPKAHLRNKSYSLIIMHKYDCSMSYCLSKKLLTPQQRLQAIYQISLGLQRLHALGTVHRDIGLKNILCDLEKNRFALADFGESISTNAFPKESQTYFSKDIRHLILRVIKPIIFGDNYRLKSLDQEFELIDKLPFSNTFKKQLHEFEFTKFSNQETASFFEKCLQEFEDAQNLLSAKL